MASYTVGDPPKSYTTIQLGIDAIPGNLSGHGKEHVQVYAKAAGYAETLDINAGFSNASDNVDYVDVQAMVSHGGLRENGIVVDISSALLFVVDIGNYAHVHGFCFTGVQTRAGDTHNLFGRLGTWVYDNILYDISQSGSNWIFGITQYDVGNKALNNQIINMSALSNTRVVGIRQENPGTALAPQIVANNSLYIPSATAYAGIDPVDRDYVYCHNNYVAVGAGSAYYRLSGAHNQITYNISSDATADDWGGTGNLVSKAAANQFVSVVAGSEILYPKRGSMLLRNGADMSAYLTSDCRGLARVYEDEPYFTTGAIHVPPARVVANLTNRRGNLRPNCYHETI